MNWHPITEKPEEGRSVWMLTRTFDRLYPGSFSIIGGIVRHNSSGWWGIPSELNAWVGPDTSRGENYLVIGWLYLEDFSPLPEWFTETLSK